MANMLRHRVVNPLCAKPYQEMTKLLKDKYVSQEYLDYNYIQTSKIPTLHFQRSLPRLPIPKLELTCERYLAAQRPLQIDEAFRKTSANVKRFCETDGKTLQKLLKEFDKKNKHTSYICDMWFDMYLRDRKPLPINYNPILVCHNDKRPEYNDQLTRATNLVISSLRFHKALKASFLEPEVFHLNAKKSDNETFRKICGFLPESMAWYGAFLMKAYPLDMSQYHSLFNSTRIPETDKDRLFSKPDSTHITVQYKGHFYAFRVLSVSNDIIPPESILARLNYIINDDVTHAEYPVGVLTTLNRDKWATLRHQLAEMGNETELKLIDSALFHVCLDNETVDEDPDKITKQFLHSDGTNRWFDKSFSLIVTKDACAGVNFEHAWGDGVAVLRYIQDIYRDSLEKPRVTIDTPLGNDPISEVHRLDMRLDDKLKAAIKEAKIQYKSTCKSMDVNSFLLEGIGRNICKTKVLSPDAIMQLAFQVAYHKLTGKFVPTYESCSTAAFKHGRTETIRPCTTATKDFSLAINSNSRPSNSDLMNMIVECSKVHSQLTKEAAMGQGFDRHLYALRQFAIKNNINSNIFEDPAYAWMNYNIISTSTLNSPAVFTGGFGPVVKDGLGVAYVIKDNELGASVTNYPAYSDGKGFIEALKQSFREIYDIIGYKQ